MPVLTVPGANGTTISIPFSTSTNASLASAILGNVYTAAASGSLDAVNASTNPSPTPSGGGTVHEFVLDQTGSYTIPAGFGNIVDANIAATLTGGSATNEAIVTGNNSFVFLAGSGSGTIVGGGGAETIAGATAGGGNYNVYLDSGASVTAALPTGNNYISVGSNSSGAVFLGSGSNTVSAGGAETVVAGSGATTLAAASTANGTVLFGGSGGSVFLDQGAHDIAVAGSGAETVFAYGSSGSYYTGSSSFFEYVNNGTGNYVVGGPGQILAYGGNTGSTAYYFVGPSSSMAAQFYLIGQAGTSTIITGNNSQQAVVFGGAGTSAALYGPGTNLFIAGSGNETLNAAGGTGNNVFFGGSGSETLSGGSGNDFFIAGTGAETLTGGGGANYYSFTFGSTGGLDTITDFGNASSSNPNVLLLKGYSSVTQSTASGSLVITLNDNTTIKFLGVTSQLSGNNIQTS